MKTLVTSLLLAMSVAMSSTSFAQVKGPDQIGKTQTSVLPAKDGKVDVVVGETDGSLLIQIVDKQGKTLLRKAVDKQDSNTRIRFNLNELPDGVYEVVITEGGNRQVKDVVLGTYTSDTYRIVTMS